MKRLLFCGELPPLTTHGASISNDINLNVLRKQFDVVVVEEFSDMKFHKKFSVTKIGYFLKSLFVFFLKCFFGSYEYYYGVIYLSTLGIIKNIVTSFLFKLMHPGSKIIFHFHRSDFKVFVGDRINLYLFKLLNLFVYQYILLSETQKRQFDNIQKTNSVTLHNTIKLEISNNSYKTKRGEHYALFIGNYIEEKGILDLIKAVKKYNSTRTIKLILKCYGNCGDLYFFDKLKKITELDPNIMLNGPIYHIEKMKVIGNASFTVLASYNEGMPLSLLESISVGTPMIITNVGYVSEVLDKNYPFYCTAGDINSIVKCFLSYERMDNLDSFKESLRLTYEHKFSNIRHEEKLLKIFKN